MSDVRSGDLFVALPFVDGDAHAGVESALRAGAEMALVSDAWDGLARLEPELRERCVAVADVVGSFRQIAARLRRRFSYPVIAIAGCNGKTTTKEMLAALLSAPGRRVVRTPGTDNGFLGLPRTLCDRAHHTEARPDAVVLEIGIDTKGAMAEHVDMVRPDMVLITALGPEHLDGLGDVESAVREELVSCERAPGARRVVPWADPEIRSRPWLVRDGDVAVVREAAPGDARDWPAAGAVLSFRAEPRGETCEVLLAWYPDRDPARPAFRGELRVPMPGAHNAQSCALAVAAALALGWAPEEVMAGWKTFSPPPWRSRVVPLDRGMLLVDDCFNASPLSMRAAFEVLGDPAWAGRPQVAVLGDMLDLGADPGRWHRELAGPLSRVSGVRAFLFGRTMKALGEELRAIENAGCVAGNLEDGDPVELIAGLDVSPETIFLVKGSRGKRMERVSRYLEVAFCRDRAVAERAVSEVVTTVGVVGSRGLSETARTVAAALRSVGSVGFHGRGGASIDDEEITARPGARGGFEVACRCFVRGAPHLVVEIAHEHLLESIEENPVHVAIFTGLSEDDLPPGAELERHLAENAQVFTRGRGLVAAVLRADDPTSDLLAEVIPRSVRVFRYGTVEEAAQLVVRVLGGSLPKAAVQLC